MYETTGISPAPRPSLWLGSFVLVLVLSLAAIALFEGVLRLWWPQRKQAVRINDGIAQTCPWGLRPGARTVVRGPEFSTEYRIGADGLRDASQHPVPKPAGTFRILVVGDSFTYGIGNNYDEIWPVLLERQLAARGMCVDIVKAGVPGYDTRTELLMMRRLAPIYDPDLVLLAFLPNDLFTNSAVSGLASGNEDQPSRETFRLDTVALMQRLLFQNDSFYTRLYMMTARSQYFVEPPGPHVAGQYVITTDLLAQAAGYAGSRKMRFAVLSIPQDFQVLVKARGMRLPNIDVDAVDRRLGDYAAGQGFRWLPVMDQLVEEYRRKKSDFYYRLDGHLTPAGNRVIATWLADRVQSLFGEVRQSQSASR